MNITHRKILIRDMFYKINALENENYLLKRENELLKKKLEKIENGKIWRIINNYFKLRDYLVNLFFNNNQKVNFEKEKYLSKILNNLQGYDSPFRLNIIIEKEVFNKFKNKIIYQKKFWEVLYDFYKIGFIIQTENKDFFNLTHKIFPYILYQKNFIQNNFLIDLNLNISYINNKISFLSENLIYLIDKEKFFFPKIKKYFEILGNFITVTKIYSILRKNFLEKIKYKKISIVFVNFNNSGIIEKCVDAAIKKSKNYDFEIIVVDNFSVDGSYEFLKKRFGRKIKLIQTEINNLSRSRNLGVEEASGDIVVFLDSDQEVIFDFWLDLPLYYLNQYSKLLTLAWGFAYVINWEKFLAINYNELLKYNYNNSKLILTNVSYLGGALIISKENFLKLGKFDEKFSPFEFEDVDFSIRAKKKGFMIGGLTNYVILHHTNKTTSRNIKLLNESFNKNKLILEKKHPDLQRYLIFS